MPGLIQESKKTVWVLGDQLNRDFAALAQATPSTHRVLMVESSAKVRSKKWHIQRAHFVITSMRRFAQELREAGFDVDYRKSETLSQGLHEHRSEAKDRVARLPLRGRDRVGQSEEGPVGEAVAVDQIERLGHGC